MAVYGLVSLGEEILAGLGRGRFPRGGASLCGIEILPGRAPRDAAARLRVGARTMRRATGGRQAVRREDHVIGEILSSLGGYVGGRFGFFVNPEFSRSISLRFSDSPNRKATPIKRKPGAAAEPA